VEELLGNPRANLNQLLVTKVRRNKNVNKEIDSHSTGSELIEKNVSPQDFTGIITYINK
jgi:hypothetical protein